MYPIYEQIWHKPDINDPFHVVIADTKRIKGKDVFKVITERTKRSGIVTRGTKCAKTCFIGEVGYRSL